METVLLVQQQNDKGDFLLIADESVATDGAPIDPNGDAAVQEITHTNDRERRADDPDEARRLKREQVIAAVKRAHPFTRTVTRIW